MNGSRIPTDEEEALFREALRDARPPAEAAETATGPLSSAAKRRRLRHEDLVSSGLNGRTAEKLRRGQLEPQARIDLHGMSQAQAHRALPAFLRSSQARGLRLVLVVTGKGQGKRERDRPFDLGLDRSQRGVLKTMTERWLLEGDFVPLIAHIRPAHRRHGGAGAYYVYLRRP